MGCGCNFFQLFLCCTIPQALGYCFKDASLAAKTKRRQLEQEIIWRAWENTDRETIQFYFYRMKAACLLARLFDLSMALIFPFLKPTHYVQYFFFLVDLYFFLMKMLCLLLSPKSKVMTLLSALRVQMDTYT